MTGNFTFDALKPMQKKFIVFLVEECSVLKDVLTRKELDEYADEWGYLYAPAWVVKNDDRRVNRGLWFIPEITDYIQSEKAVDRILQPV
tara:strand:- start:2600 stop:2866 length:267 start_codon:yes stop_codon:yes gene_type:complete